MKKRYYQYRIVWYDKAGYPQFQYPRRMAVDDWQSMSDELDQLVGSGKATGGHVEKLIEFQGGHRGYFVAFESEEGVL